MKASVPVTTTISVITRHSNDCPKKDNSTWRRCNCRKSLYLYEDGKVSYVSAKTRSWEQAEKVAQAERDRRDPVKIELARIADQEEAKKETLKAKDSRLDAALDQWIMGLKVEESTGASYETFRRVLLRWAERNGIVNLSDVTPDSLDAWVAAWNPEAKEKLNRIRSNTQSFRLTRIKSFFRWATGLQKIDRDPAAMLKSIRGEQEEETRPLTPAQFEELLAATYKYDADRRVEKDRFGADLRAIFLVQRWTGLRLADVLMLPRSQVVGHRIETTTKKTGDKIDRPVPVAVIEALNAVPVRKTMHDDQYFWSRKCNHRVLAGMWTPRVKLLNKYLSFKFHTHMLRDTFAVELLLAGVSLDKVSRLLTHKSTRVTEKHYAPWVKAREEQLEKEMMAAMCKMGAKFAAIETVNH